MKKDIVKIVLKSYKEYLKGLYSSSKVSTFKENAKMPIYSVYIFELFFNIYAFFQGFLFKGSIRKKKYIFVNSRFEDIICNLNKEDVVVMGGGKDLLFCVKNKIKFVWIGYLVKAFNIYYYYGRDGVYIKALTLIEKKVTISDHKSLLLWEDTLKVGLSFANLFNKNKLVDVICIQHGLFFLGSKVRPAGINSNYNFFIKDSQKKFINNSNSRNSCVIGLPYDITERPLFNKNIYLVGIGGLGTDDPIYLYSLWVYSKIYGEFIGSGYKVFYRPHPTENVNFCKFCFPDINIVPKKDLFTSSLSVYIGFNSTLLYEAMCFGNISIRINPVEDSININDFNTNLTIDEKDIKHIVNKLNKYIKNNDITYSYEENIGNRFVKCINLCRG
ncbi:hypothetical protein HN615_16375 [Candidatus Woesearchaeota archaeon]|nr:hypothetical protein [Candidatus Woesearchaeota archaeon]